MYRKNKSLIIAFNKILVSIVFVALITLVTINNKIAFIVIGAILFSCISIYFKNLLYIYIFLLPLLPVTFALNISDSIPLISFSRILLFLLIVYEFIKQKLSLKVVLNSSGVYILIFYFIPILISNLINLNKYSLMGIVNILIEQILFYIILRNNLDLKKIDIIMKIIIFTAFILATLGIVEAITKFNVFSFLDLAKRENLRSSGEFIRMGSIRIETSFGHSLGFGLYLVMFSPIIFFYSVNLKKCNLKYIGYITSVLMIINICLTMSRSTLLILIVQFGVYFLLVKGLKKVFLVYLLILGISAFIVIANIPNIENIGVVQTTKNSIYSTLDVVFGTDLAKNFSDNDNTDPYIYRNYLIYYTFNQDFKQLMEGHGIGFLRIQPLYFNIPKLNPYEPIRTVTIDNYYILSVLQSGLISGIGIILLFIIYLKRSYRIFKTKNQYSYLALGIFLGVLGYSLHLFMVDELGTMRMVWIPLAILDTIYKEYKKSGACSNDKN
ncbi:hypothetical protein ACV3RW_10520 [Clostridium perfringens]